MESHACVVMLVALGVLASVSTQGNINGREYESIYTSDDTGASTTPRAHDLSISPVPDTDVAPSLGKAAPRRRQQFAERENVKKKTKKTAKDWYEIICSPRNKCNNTDVLDFSDRNCFCDALCHTYGDCCKDARGAWG